MGLCPMGTAHQNRKEISKFWRTVDLATEKERTCKKL